MPAAGDLAAAPRRSGVGTWAGTGRAASRTASASASRSSLDGPRGRRVPGEPEHLPAAGRREPLAVRVAEVVGVRLGVGRQRAEHRRLVGVDVGQRADRGAAAGGARTAAGRTHGPDGTRRVRRPPIRLAAVEPGSRRRGPSGTGAGAACADPAILPEPPGRPELPHRPRALRRARPRHRHRHRPALAGPARPGRVRRRGRAADPRRLDRRHRPALVAGARHRRHARPGWCSSGGRSSTAARTAPTSRRWCSPSWSSRSPSCSASTPSWSTRGTRHRPTDGTPAVEMRRPPAA